MKSITKFIDDFQTGMFDEVEGDFGDQKIILIRKLHIQLLSGSIRFN